MGYFNWKQTIKGTYLDTRNPPFRNRSLGEVKTHITASDNYASGDQYGNTLFSPVYDNLAEGSVLEEMIPRQPTQLHMMFRKIYLRDAIAGTVVDLFSNLPWGKSWDLIFNTDDPKIRQMYLDMMDGIDIWSQLPMLSREIQIIGRIIGSLSFNERLGHWDALVPVDPDFAMIEPMPLVGVKPLIDVLSTPAWRNFARSTDPRIVELKSRISPQVLDMIQNQSGYIPLDPLNTLWVARKVNHYDHIGTSLFTRILPAWAYETALWNASLIGARRRNRAILLVTAGIEDDWLPTDEEVSSLTNLFMQADEDPVGGVITVRNGVEVSEVRDPTAIWGISQEFDFLSTLKMRSLGVSEAYLSGETNVSNMESARTSLGKQILAFKEMMLREIFYKQLFPTFARIHNFQRITKAELAHGVRTSGYTKAYISGKAAMDIPHQALIIPELVTEETLRPEGDPAWVEMLVQLKELGLPLPLRLLASAAGYDLDKAMAMMSEDAILRKRLVQLGTESPDSGGGGGGEEMSDLGAGGGGAPPKEEGPGGSIEDTPEESSSGGGGMPKPKWSINSQSKSPSQSKALLNTYHNERLINALAKIHPNLLAEMQVPHSRALVPYGED